MCDSVVNSLNYVLWNTDIEVKNTSKILAVVVLTRRPLSWRPTARLPIGVACPASLSEQVWTGPGGQTDTTEHITFPQTMYAGGNKSIIYHAVKA